MKNEQNLIVDWIIEKIVDLDRFIAQNGLNISESFLIQLQEVGLSFSNILFQMGVGIISRSVFNELLYDYSDQVNNENIHAVVDLLIAGTTIGFNMISILCDDVSQWFGVFQDAQIDNVTLSDDSFLYSQRNALYLAIQKKLILINQPFEFTISQYQEDAKAV